MGDSSTLIHDPFVRNHLVLCNWQDDLELTLYLFCYIRMPEVVKKRRWTSYRAAELTLLTEEVIRFCMDKKLVMADCGISGEEREDFMLNLHTARMIRHAAVHRYAVSKQTMNRFSTSFLRIISTARKAIGSDFDAEKDRIFTWMGGLGWPFEAINSESLLALRDNSDIGRRQLLEDQAIAKSKKAVNKQRALEASQRAETKRRLAAERVENEQRVAEQKRLEKQQRSEQQKEVSNRKRAKNKAVIEKKLLEVEQRAEARKRLASGKVENGQKATEQKETVDRKEAKLTARTKLQKKNQAEPGIFGYFDPEIVCFTCLG